MPLSTPQTSETSLPSDLQACHDLIRDLAFLLESRGCGYRSPKRAAAKYDAR